MWERLEKGKKKVSRRMEEAKRKNIRKIKRTRNNATTFTGRELAELGGKGGRPRSGGSVTHADWVRGRAKVLQKCKKTRRGQKRKQKAKKAIAKSGSRGGQKRQKKKVSPYK